MDGDDVSDDCLKNFVNKASHCHNALLRDEWVVSLCEVVSHSPGYDLGLGQNQACSFVGLKVSDRGIYGQRFLCCGAGNMDKGL